MAGVPRASLVVIAATLSIFDLPEAGLLLIMGIDHFLDMGRSATNVVGNSIATAVVAKWEGELRRRRSRTRCSRACTTRPRKPCSRPEATPAAAARASSARAPAGEAAP